MSKFIKASHDRNTLTVQYVNDSGNVLLRSGGTIAWRFNNPGNMRPKSNGLYPGQIGVGDTKSGKFAIFDSYIAGRNEKKALLRRKYNEFSLKEAIYIYAPPNENNTEAYIDFLVKKTSIQRSTKLSSLNDSALDKLMDAMQEKEGFNGNLNTRKENWVYTTAVSVSDGSKPLSDQKITATINGQKKELNTNSNGSLPLLPHFKSGEVIIFSSMIDGVEKVIGEVITSLESQTVHLINNTIKYSAKLMPQNGILKAANKKIEYKVVSGDNLSKIAKRFRVTAHQIQEWNYLENSNHIFSGQILTIGGYASNKFLVDLSSKFKVYKIKSNDSVFKICKLFKISEKEFLKLNPQIKDKSQIKVGDNVKVPNKDISSVSQFGDNSKESSSNSLVTSIMNQAENLFTNTNGQVESTRSKEGTGEGLAIIPLNNKEAPWMAIVLRELKQWCGKQEGVITKTDNYHKLVGWGGIKTLVGTDQAWCASFANYCLQEAKYTKSKDTVSALSFRRDTQNFVKIDKPIFGALATIPTFEGASPEATSGTGHVAFVYSLDKTDGRFLMIGGNQDDQITIVDRKISSFRFYVPKVYHEYAKTQKLEKKISVDEVYKQLGLKAVKSGGGTR
ncbi:LysM peptidoglycan-binding domain-containing protein [Acinetobacter entericus]|uniref:LysM peptidoglycan-binding domain-containing protein n=1 Tax=Acinetobacter entericus TaxID=2989714 RepID=UPI00224000CE|nr:LysM peptidoglycan-binding domain-containing protein [Acinetobacter entericus]